MIQKQKEKLRLNLEYNKCKNVIPIQQAVGEKSGQYSDKIYRIWGNEPEKKEYPFTTIDDFVDNNKLTRVDLIKIDVDSFDFEVLKGTIETLKKFNPYILVELNHALSKRNQTNTQAIEWLIEQGYKKSLVNDLDNFILKHDIVIDSKKKMEIYF